MSAPETVSAPEPTRTGYLYQAELATEQALVHLRRVATGEAVCEHGLIAAKVEIEHALRRIAKLLEAL